MATTLDDLQSLLDALRKARATGVHSVKHGDTETVYKSDAEMAAAEAALLSLIASFSGSSTSRPMSSLASFSRGDIFSGRIGRFTR